MKTILKIKDATINELRKHHQERNRSTNSRNLVAIEFDDSVKCYFVTKEEQMEEYRKFLLSNGNEFIMIGE